MRSVHAEASGKTGMFSSSVWTSTTSWLASDLPRQAGSKRMTANKMIVAFRVMLHPMTQEHVHALILTEVCQLGRTPFVIKN
jgi:hypothetical protein